MPKPEIKEVEKIEENIDENGKGKKPDENGKKPEDGNKITISQKELDETISQAVDEAVKKTSSNEKTKLYKNLEKKDKELVEANNKLSLYQKEEKEKADKLEEERLEKLSADERVQEQLRSSEEKIGRVHDAFDLLQKQTDKKLLVKDLELHREKLILSAQGQVIPELVNGNTLEEIQQSFEKSKVEYNRIVEIEINNYKQTEKNSEKKNPVSTEIPQHRKVPTIDDESEKTNLDDLMSMSKEDYEIHKEEELKKLGY